MVTPTIHSSSSPDFVNAKSKLIGIMTEQQHEEKHEDDRGITEQQADDTKEQINALLQSLAILLKLATMDTADYQASLQKGGGIGGGGTSSTSSNNVCQLQKSLEDIQRTWRLEETPILKLTAAIHGFHSTINNLQQDAEEHTVLYNNLAQQVQQYQKRNVKLEHALSKVCAKNEALRAKIKHRAQEKKTMVQQVQNYVQQVKDAKKEQREMEEQKVAYQLHAHQHFLQLQKPQTVLRGRSVSEDLPIARSDRSCSPSRKSSPRRAMVAARRRIMSQDAPSTKGTGSSYNSAEAMFSSDVNLDQDDNYRIEGLEPFSGRGEPAQYSSYQNLSNSTLLDDNSSVISATSSASSLVTDEGVATIRFGIPCETPTRMRTGSKDSIPGEKQSSFWGATAWPTSSKKSKVPSILTLTFPSASTIGLQFEKKTIEIEPQEVKTLQRPKASLSETLLNPTSKKSKAKSTANNTSSQERQQQPKEVESGGFQLKWSNVFGKSHHTSAESESPLNTNEPASATNAFVVSGFSGFNYELNQCPTLGSRLVAISGVPVDVNWSLAELQERIQKIDAERSINSITATESGIESTTSTKRVLTLSFSDDHLSKSKKEQQSHIGKILHGSGDNKDAVSGTDLGATAEATVGSKLASSFNFLKKGPSAETTQKQDKQGGDHIIKPESSSMTMPKMPTFFSTTSKGQDLSDSNGVEDDGRINDNDKSSPTSLEKPKMPTIAMPKMTSIFGNKAKVQDSSTDSSEQKLDTPGKDTKQSEQHLMETSEEQRHDSSNAEDNAEEKCDEQPSMGTDEAQKNDSDALPSKTAAAESQTASSNLFHFFSSQSLMSTPKEASEKEEKKEDPDVKEESPTEDEAKETKDNVQLEPRSEADAASSHQVESKNNDVDAAMHQLDPLTDSTTSKDMSLAKKMEEPTDSIKQELSASDKFRSSMATMGKMFSKPFVHPTALTEKMDAEDSIL